MDIMDDTSAGSVPMVIKDVISTFARYSEQTETVVHITHEGFRNMEKIPEILSILHGGAAGHVPTPADERRLMDARWKADRAAREANAGFPIVHAHSLMGLWGALECFIEDLFVASIEANPSLLAADAFKKVRLPAALVVESDSHARAVAVLPEATRAVDANMGVGAGRFEGLLKMVNLDGGVHDRIRESIFHAQQIRNIWAHRGGVADARFIERCPTLGYATGDRVDMDAPQFLHLMHGIHMYVATVVDRCLLQAGSLPISPECVGYRGTMKTG